MKALVALVGLFTVSLLSGEAALVVKTKAYTATGEVVPEQGTVPRGTRLLFTCDVEGLPEGNVVINYKWYHNCDQGRCEIRKRDPYYRAVNNTLLVDTTSWSVDQRWHICEVDNKTDFTTLSLIDSSAPFLFTPSSLLLNHALITDVQQITGGDGQQWIKCTSGRDGGYVHIFSEVDKGFMVGNRMDTATIGPGRYPRNGLYYCSVGQPPYHYISLFLRNSSKLPTPIVSVWDNTTWTLTSPDGSRVERYIVEFECSVRNITFVEKYMSVSASGGTGQAATNVSCFGGLGQLYRVKVWAVSGPSISRQPAVKVVITDGPALTVQVLMPTPTSAGDTGTPKTVSTSAKTDTLTSSQSGTPVLSPEPADANSDADQPRSGTFIGVGVGVGVFLLFAVVTVMGLIVAIVVVKRKAAYKQKGGTKMRDSAYYNNAAVVQQKNELEEKGLGADYDDVGEDEEKVSIVDGFDPYEDIDSKAQMKSSQKPAPKESSTPASATNIGELYAVVDKSKKKGVKKKEGQDGPTVTNKDDLYAMPMKKKGKMTDEEEGKVVSGGAEEGDENNDAAGLKYEPKADSESQQQSEGDSKALNVDMLYAVVDKSRKKKK